MVGWREASTAMPTVYRPVPGAVPDLFLLTDSSHHEAHTFIVPVLQVGELRLREGDCLAKVTQTVELVLAQKQPGSRVWALTCIISSFKPHSISFHYYQLHFTDGKTEVQGHKSRK